MPTGAQANLSKTITDRYALNYEIITPFSMHTNQYGNIIYTGVVQDNKSARIKAYRHSITIEQIKTRNQTIERAKQWALLFASQGFTHQLGQWQHLGQESMIREGMRSISCWSIRPLRMQSAGQKTTAISLSK